MQIHYRDEEAIYVQAASDRVTVVFSTVFREEADRIFGKVFLQEFVDARRQPSIQTAPQVLFTAKEPPLEIRSAPGLKNSEDIGYVTFGALVSTLPRNASLTRAGSHLPPPLQQRGRAVLDHLAHPALPKLPPLPHQVLQGLHALAHAFPCRRVPEGP